MNADYFSHDAQMRNDAKIRAVRRKFPQGYSVWCMLLETLTEAELLRIKTDDTTRELLAADFDVEVEELEQIIGYLVQLDLLHYDGGYLYCKRLDERLGDMFAKRGIRLWEVRQNNATPQEVKQIIERKFSK